MWSTTTTPAAEPTPFMFEHDFEPPPAVVKEEKPYEAQLALLRKWRWALDAPAPEAAKPVDPGAASVLWPQGMDPHIVPKNMQPAGRLRRRDYGDAMNSNSVGLYQSGGQKVTPRGRQAAQKDVCWAYQQPELPETVQGNYQWVAQIPSLAPLDYRTVLAPYRSAIKCRETRQIEKEDKRRWQDTEEWRRKKANQFVKQLEAKGVEQRKFARQRRQSAGKCARACKAYFDHLSHRAEVEESKAGRKRLQALRANDMDAYTKLVEETKNDRLKFLLAETDKYIVSIADKVRAQRENEEFEEARAQGRSSAAAVSIATTSKADDETPDQTNNVDPEQRRQATSAYYQITHQKTEEVRQPKMLLGGHLKEYQLAGVSWLVSLYNNRLNGILADEMGLGKTIQSIALLAHLMEEKGNYGPFLVVAPLSTLSNWANEFAKWTPSIQVLSYKGPPAARKDVQKEIHAYCAWLKRHRATEEQLGGSSSKRSHKKKKSPATPPPAVIPEDLMDDHNTTSDDADAFAAMDDDDDAASRTTSANGEQQPAPKRRRTTKDDESGASSYVPSGFSTTAHNKPNFNVVLTTYEYIMRDRAVLRKVEWQYIIVDEGHRMKNANSKFAQTLGNLYTAKRRLLLTGTPLQNSLPELWALLNFLLPSIFQSCDSFEGWFNKPFSQFGAAGLNETESAANISNEERMLVINRLHEVLRPFVLRRVKAAVLGQLPEKIEKVVRCDLSPWQKVLYQQIQQSRMTNGDSTKKRSLLLTDDDDGLGSDTASQQQQQQSQEEGPAATATHQVTRGLNNILMQLRKCCNHPYLFRTDAYRIDEMMIRASGKFLLLDGMLPLFKAGGHRVLLFSQMTAVMDLLEEFFTFRGHSYLRLDGSTAADERERRVAQFNDPCSPTFVFLLSTRAGGLGLNLASADTVVIFDSDWNPMMDSQAQDRAHRIGQRNDVRVFRLIAAAPVEERILARATDKLNMNSLVVEAGKFNKDSQASERRQMLEELLKEYDDAESNTQDDETASNNGSTGGNGKNHTSGSGLCETLATSNDEFELYKKIDTIRDGGLKHLHTDEVPAWVTSGCESAADYDQQQSKKIATGLANHKSSFLDPQKRGARKRKDTPYYDSLSERSFLKLIESGSLDKPQVVQHYKAIGTPGKLRIPLIKVDTPPPPAPSSKSSKKSKKRK